MISRGCPPSICPSPYPSHPPPTPELWGTKALHTDEDEIGSYLGVEPTGQGFYSYIDPDTGAYASLGMIERVSRFADTPGGAGLFQSSTDEGALAAICEAACSTPAMAGLNPELVDRLLRAARRAERVTRHKYNPACPTLGSRAELVEAGILTDTLPAG